MSTDTPTATRCILIRSLSTRRHRQATRACRAPYHRHECHSPGNNLRSRQCNPAVCSRLRTAIVHLRRYQARYRRNIRCMVGHRRSKCPCPRSRSRSHSPIAAPKAITNIHYWSTNNLNVRECVDLATRTGGQSRLHLVLGSSSRTSTPARKSIIRTSTGHSSSCKLICGTRMQQGK